MNIARRSILGMGLVTVTSVTRAAEPPKPAFRITMLLPDGWDDASGGFRDYLGQRGIAADLQIRDARSNIGRTAEFVDEINATNPDLVYIAGSAMALAALGPYAAPDPLRQVHGVPVVLNLVVDPAACGIVHSLSEPRRNVTGVIFVAPAAAQLRSIIAYRQFRTLATIYRPDDPDGATAVAELQARLDELGLRLLTFPLARTPPGSDATPALAAALAQAREHGAEWLYIPPDWWLEARRVSFTRAAIAAGVPSFAASDLFLTEAEALSGLVCPRASAGALAGRLAEQILLDKRHPASLPFIRPDKFSILIRIETAEALRFYPPMSLLRFSQLR